MPSGPCCMVKNCRKNKKEHPELTFFTVPKKMDIAQKWIEFSERQDIEIDKTYTMCSEHFSSKQFRSVHPRKMLFSGSIPCMKGPSANENEGIVNEDNSEHISVQSDHDAVIPLDSTNSSTTNVQRSPKHSHRTLKRIQQLKNTMNFLRYQLYGTKPPLCFCRGNHQMSSSKAALYKLINISKASLSKKASTLFLNELRANFVMKHRRRYDDNLQEMCLLWYFASPKVYTVISKCLSLPTPRTLKKWQSKLKLSPGISTAMIESLRLYFSKKTQPKTKICSLIFHEISLSEQFNFDQSKVIGSTFRRNEKPTTALVCMARGLAYNWKYVIGYWFLNHAATNEYLYSIVLNSVDAAQQAGLTVKAIICDQSPVYESVANKLEISTEQCFFLRNDEKIYFVYDVPQLLISIQYNLAKCDLEYLGKQVSWKYIKDVCTSTHPLRPRLLPKITNELSSITTSNTMGVEYAAQILSESMSVAMLILSKFGELSADSQFTSDFISDMDKTFDCLNSRRKVINDKKKMNYAMSVDSPHRDFLIKMRDNFRCCKFLSEESVPLCINGFILTINSVLQLVDDLRNTYDVSKLLTCRLNKDPVGNFIATLRQQHGCCQILSSQQFEYGLQQNYINCISKLCSDSKYDKDFRFSLEKLKKLRDITSNKN